MLLSAVASSKSSHHSHSGCCDCQFEHSLAALPPEELVELDELEEELDDELDELVEELELLDEVDPDEEEVELEVEDEELPDEPPVMKVSPAAPYNRKCSWSGRLLFTPGTR